VRAVRLAREDENEHGSTWTVIQLIAAKIGCFGETLRE
jgi:transposase